MTTKKICISCMDDISSTNHSVEFRCPNCEKEQIIRCGKCRKLMILWKCPNCGFEGP